MEINPRKYVVSKKVGKKKKEFSVNIIAMKEM